jgi:dihydrodipicolinate synthase/N-acetylneuraminate lyase
VNDPHSRFTGARRELVERLWPRGIPRLWCPLLTHFDESGLDRPRMRAHLGFVKPWVGGFLIPGSTGEGWSMPDAEVRELIAFMIDEVGAVGGHLLIGILKTEVSDVLLAMQEFVAWMKDRTQVHDALESLVRSSVCGFAVCPPTGPELSQRQIKAGLEEILSLELPVALYQLPQVTQNEMAPETVAALALRYPGFYLFKDSSGRDAVASSGFKEAFLVRGAEGGYAEHLVRSEGRYDGLLLSTANSFARPLAEMLDGLERGRVEAAAAFSGRLSALCDELFPLASEVGYGNPFTNANKAIDHFFAHGPKAADLPPPRLHSGMRLPGELVSAARLALARQGLLPERGYLGER